MKRILLITDNLDAVSGGAEKQIYLLATGLVQRGWEVEILVLQSNCRDQGLFERERIRVFVENIRRVYSFQGYRLAYKWREIISRRRYCAVFTYHFGSDLWASIFLRPDFSGLIVSMRRDDGFWMRPYHPWVYRYVIHPRVDLICAVSDHVKEGIISREGVKEEKVRVIYNGVELNRFTPQPKVGGNEFILLYVANFSSVKNHITLLEAVRRLKGKMGRFKLLLAGRDKGEEGRLRGFVQRYGLENEVEFLGERRDIPGLIESADVCLQVSLSEGMSNTLLEYMAGARPVVASDIVSNREVLSETGVLVDPNDPEEIASVILDLYLSPEQRREIGLLARKRVEEFFSVDRMIDEYESLLKEAICEM